MNRHSCNLNDDRWKDDSKELKGEEGDVVGYANSFTNDAMPDAEAVLIVEPEQHNVKRITLQIQSTNPETGPYSTQTVAYRHLDSGYEEG
jgi:hypothetical protein